MIFLKEGQVYPVPPFTSSVTRLLSVDTFLFCVISGIMGFYVRCVVCSLRLERGWGWGEGGVCGYLGSLPKEV